MVHPDEEPGTAEPLPERIRAQTRLVSPPLVPELRLHLITDGCPLWHATEAEALAAGLPEPYWAFCWPGGQALARHLLDHPDLVRGRRVLDFGSGGAVEALAALRAGASGARAADLDPVAAVAARLNAQANGIAALETTTEDLVGTRPEAEVVLAGDVFYDRELAARGLEWLRSLARAGRLVLVGDPSRGFLDTGGLVPLATYRTAGDGEIAGPLTREVRVFRVPG